MTPRKSHRHPQNEVAFSAFSGFALSGPHGLREEHGVRARAFPGENGAFLCSRSCPFCIFFWEGVYQKEKHKKKQHKQQKEKEEEEEEEERKKKKKKKKKKNKKKKRKKK